MIFLVTFQISTIISYLFVTYNLVRRDKLPFYIPTRLRHLQLSHGSQCVLHQIFWYMATKHLDFQRQLLNIHMIFSIVNIEPNIFECLVYSVHCFCCQNNREPKGELRRNVGKRTTWKRLFSPGTEVSVVNDNGNFSFKLLKHCQRWWKIPLVTWKLYCFPKSVHQGVISICLFLNR